MSGGFLSSISSPVTEQTTVECKCCACGSRRASFKKDSWQVYKKEKREEEEEEVMRDISVSQSMSSPAYGAVGILAAGVAAAGRAQGGQARLQRRDQHRLARQAVQVAVVAPKLLHQHLPPLGL